MSKKEWMTVKQVADYFNMSISQVNYMIGFPGVTKEKRKNIWYVDPKSVEDNMLNINQNKNKRRVNRI